MSSPTLTHTKVLTVPEGADSSVVRTSDWNAEHTLATTQTDVLLGRSTSGAGAVEEITCTSAGRALLDDASELAQRTTLGVGTGDSPTLTALTLSSLTSGRVAYVTTAGLLTDSANLTYNGTALTVTGNQKITSYLRVGSASAPAATTAGNLTIDSYATIGSNAAADANARAARIAGTLADASGDANLSQIVANINAAAVATSNYHAIQATCQLDSGATGTYTGAVFRGARFNAYNNNATLALNRVEGFLSVVGTLAAGNVTGARNLNLDCSVAAGSTITTRTGVHILNASGAGTLTTQLGVDVLSLTKGATNIGVRVAAPSGGATANYAIQLSDTGGTAAGAITFGTDTTLYRSAANTIRTDDVFALAAGLSTSYAKAGGSIYDHFTDTSVGGAEADIYTNTTPASIFGTNGDKIRASYHGNFVTVGTEATQLKVYFGGTAIWDSTAVVPATGTTSWRVYVEIIRVSSTVVRYAVSLSTSAALGYTYCTVGELTGLTLSNTNILKVTGFSSGTGSGAGDIVGKAGSVEWLSAA